MGRPKTQEKNEGEWGSEGGRLVERELWRRGRRWRGRRDEEIEVAGGEKGNVGKREDSGELTGAGNFGGKVGGGEWERVWERVWERLGKH